YALRRLGAATSVLKLAAGADDDVAGLPAGPYRFVETRTLPLIVSDGTASTFLIGKDGIAGDFRSATLAATPEQNGAGDRLLLRNDFEIAVWSPDSGLRDTVTRLGSAITAARWHPSGAYAAYATGEAITAIELDNRDAANAYELVRAGSILDFSIDADGRTLRFIGEIGNQKGLFERTLR
ncbi:hypothetical protein HY633_01790, partial [Candidatus Uhrbacteria bacterium]|nr:hypothetical protein [Candidatus Uhrbacteria bacterium]